MSHPAETYEKVDRTFGTTLSESWGRSAYPNCKITQYPSTSAEGLSNPYRVYYSGRAASQKSPMDKYGWRAPTPYSGFWWRRSIVPSTYVYSQLVKTTNCSPLYYLWKRNTHTGGVSTDVMVQYTWERVPDSLKTAASTAAMAAFGSQSVNLAVAMMERKKTAEFVTKQVNSLAGMANAVRKRAMSLPKAIRDWRSFPARWLEYKYAWTPLVLDVYGALSALEKVEDGTYDKFVFNTKAKKFSETFVKTATSYNCVFGASGTSLYKTGSQTGTKEVRVRHSVTVRIDATMASATYVRLNDVGISNPALIAWELLPYSFVVDWFLNVGEYLQAVQAASMFTFKAGSMTCRTHERWENRPNNADPVPGVVMTGEQITESVAFRRYILGQFPTPMLQFKNPLSLDHFATGMSLMISAITGKPTKYRI